MATKKPTAPAANNKKKPAAPSKPSAAAPQKSSKKSKEELKNKYSDAVTRAGSGDLTRIELQKGSNVVRLTNADFEENWVVFVEDTEGNNRRISMGIDMKENKKKFAILFETLPDAKASHRYYFEALDGKVVKTKEGTTKTVLNSDKKLLEVGPKIFKQIAAIQGDDEFPNVDEINLKITKTGEKKNTDYQVMPNSKATPLPADLSGEIDLAMMVEETDIKTVYEILGLDYEGADDSDSDDADVQDVDDLQEDADATEDAPEEDVPEEDEPEADAPEEDGDEFTDMDRTQLKNYIKAEGLEISVYKNWTDDQIRDAIREKLAEAAPAEEDDPEPEEEELADDATVDEDDDLADLDSLDDIDEDVEEEPAPPKKDNKKKGKK